MSVIRNLRKKSGLNQEEFARLFNVHQTAVSQWETGKTSPDTDTLVKIANYFDVSVDYILGKTNIKKSSGEKPEDIAEDEDDDIVLFNREARKMTPEQRKKLLEMAKVMFGEAYNDESHK